MLRRLQKSLVSIFSTMVVLYVKKNVVAVIKVYVVVVKIIVIANVQLASHFIEVPTVVVTEIAI